MGPNFLLSVWLLWDGDVFALQPVEMNRSRKVSDIVQEEKPALTTVYCGERPVIVSLEIKDSYRPLVADVVQTLVALLRFTA